jgi:prophage antirepressor-like protein
MFLTQVFQPTQTEVVTFVDPMDGSCWFHAGSVATTLDFTTPARYLPTALEAHEYKEIQQEKGRPSLYVREEGVYLLIMASKSPYASAFKRWLAYDVLPQIRKSGGYGEGAAGDVGWASELWTLIDRATARGLEPERVIDLHHRLKAPVIASEIKTPPVPVKDDLQGRIMAVVQSIESPTTSEILKRLGMNASSRGLQMTVAGYMKDAGWRCARTRMDGKLIRQWVKD